MSKRRGLEKSIDVSRKKPNNDVSKIPIKGRDKTPEMKQKENTPTKERLLQTAFHLFAEKGYHGTTVDEIVDMANINKRMVYYYFGNKEKLYGAVLAEAYKRLEELEVEIGEKTLPVEEWMSHIVRIYFDFHGNNPEFSKLVLWENLYYGRGLESQEMKITKHPILKKLDEIITRGVKEGKLRKNLNARYLLISLIGLCQVYSANRYTLSQTLGMDLGSEKERKKGVEHTIDLLLNGILK